MVGVGEFWAAETSQSQHPLSSAELFEQFDMALETIIIIFITLVNISEKNIRSVRYSIEDITLPVPVMLNVLTLM